MAKYLLKYFLLLQLLIEWGCDIHVKALKGQTAFEMIKNDEFRDFMISMSLLLTL